MAGPVTLLALIALFTQSAPSWLLALRSVVLDQGKQVALEKGREIAIGKGNDFFRRVLHLDEKEQIRQLEQALTNAAERALTRFRTLEERDQYRAVLSTLTEISPQSEVLRTQALRLFTLSETPDFTELNERYNQHQRISAAAHNTPYQDIDITPYLTSFFDALIAELYAYPYFRSRMSESLQARAMRSMQQSLIEVVNMLRQINETLENNYTTEQFAKDVATYIAHIERTFHYLKIVGIVPRDHNKDPELDGIFVPLRIQLDGVLVPTTQHSDAIIPLLEEFPYLVLLGAPGSGKSTAMRYLAWSHAAVNQSPDDTLPALAGKPLPLRIELRRLNAERKRSNYSFLSYATEVLLQREGIEISQQMFEELLKRRSMLLLFDGLDEVATLSERREFVEEIEHFALGYPGNRILVTSRPVGYDLVPLSNQFFVHAHVQDFDDKQIRAFLEKWYIHVLHLSPIPTDDLQELEALFDALTENSRLHKLAVNPLLLTVITALHRYQRLPDRRALLYDECAKLLLENWARLKGTDARWKELHMGREDQYACVAHLGFFLHKHSQERETSTHRGSKQSAAADGTSDVPTKVMIREIERFFREQNLLGGVAEQRVEAARFLELMQVEAGLIVERGKDENGEDLYGFVHRTFQEYFAAASVYERYQQEGDAAIISEFLQAQLHDPHWREVIVLLLGKLKRKPVTVQLRQLLEGKLLSRRSAYNDILHHDLFFICQCLLEEISVENEFVEVIMSRLSNIIIHSPYREQKKDAIQYLAALVSTRQYSAAAVKELTTLSLRGDLLDLSTRIQIAENYYRKSLDATREHAAQILFHLVLPPEAPLSVQIQALDRLFRIFFENTPEKRRVAEKVVAIVQDPATSIEDALQAAKILYQSASLRIEEKEILTNVLINMAQRTDISVEHAIQIGAFFYQYSEADSKEQALGLAMLLKLCDEASLSSKTARHLAYILYEPQHRTSEQNRGSQEALSLICSTLVNTPLASDERISVASDFSQILAYTSDPYDCYWFSQTLIDVIKSAGLSLEQRLQVFSILRMLPTSWEDGEKEAAKIIIEELKTSPSFEHMLKVADLLLLFTDTQPEGIQILSQLSQHTDIGLDQRITLAKKLYLHSSEQSEEEKQAAHLLFELVHHPDLPLTSFIEALRDLYTSTSQNPAKRQLALQLIHIISHRSDLSIEQTIRTAQLLYLASSENFDAQQLATHLLSSLAQLSHLSVEQSIQVAHVLYQTSSLESEAKQYARDKLWQLIDRQDISREQKLKALEVFFTWNAHFSDTAKAVQMVKTLLQEDEARQYITAHWQVKHGHIEVDVLNAPFIAELARQDVLPPGIRDEVYHMLHNLIPQFEKLSASVV